MEEIMNQLDILKYGDLTFMGTVGKFPKEEWYTSGACGYWSVKDLVGHLASYELVLVEILNNLLNPGPTPLLDKFTSRTVNFNDEQVDVLRKDRTMEQVMDEYKTAHEQAMAAAAKIAPKMWTQNGILAWYGDQYDLDDFIVYTYYGHKREHSGQIAVFSDRFK
jgi:hypothetical protein